MKIRALVNKSQCGLSTVEFALLLPALLIFLFGTIEFSLILYDKAVITNASREGARLGVVFRANADGTPNAVTESEIRNKVNEYTPNLISLKATVQPSISVETKHSGAWSSGADLQPGDDLKVTIDYTYTFLVFSLFSKNIFSSNVSSSVSLKAVTIMRAEW